MSDTPKPPNPKETISRNWRKIEALAPPPLCPDPEREAFEKWCRQNYCRDIKRDLTASAPYSVRVVEGAWEGWQAGRSRIQTPHALPQVAPDMLDAMEEAWGIIANAHGGEWTKAAIEWEGAASRWRDKYLPMLTEAAAAKGRRAFCGPPCPDTAGAPAPPQYEEIPVDPVDLKPGQEFYMLESGGQGPYLFTAYRASDTTLFLSLDGIPYEMDATAIHCTIRRQKPPPPPAQHPLETAVALAIGEVAYQEKKWGPVEQQGHTVCEWFALVRRFTGKGDELWYRGDLATAMEQMRCIAALALSAMMQHPTPARKENE